jgi:predicted transcriptional regulator YdeE
MNPLTATSEHITGFDIVGIGIRTSNEDGQAAAAINTLWQNFFEFEVIDKIPDREGPEVYAVYWAYEGDHTKPYRFTIGCKTKADAPRGLEKVSIKPGLYHVLSAQGEQPAALVKAWESVWTGTLNRAFATDFEIYGRRFFEPGLHEVLVHVGIQS